MSNLQQFFSGGGYPRLGFRPDLGFYGPTIQGLTLTTAGTISANSIYFLPFFCNKAKTFDALVFRNSDTGANGMKVRVGVYNDGGGYPSTLLVDLGEVTLTGSAASNEVAGTITMSENTWYWLALVSDNAPQLSLDANASMDALSNIGTISMPSGTGGTPDTISLRAAHVYAALPSTAPTIDNGAPNAPRLRLKG